MFERFKQPWVLAGVGLLCLALLSVACVQFAPRLLPSLTGAASIGTDASADPSVTTSDATLGAVAAPTGIPNRNLVPVQRGPISEITPLTGRVAGMDEVAVAFPRSGKVASISVKLGDSVHQDQVLLQTDSLEILRQLSVAEAELEAANIRLEQANAQAAADSAQRQRDATDRSRNEAAQRQAVVMDAQAALHRAEDDMARVQAGASDSDLRAAQAAVNDAQMVSQRAQADQTRVLAGADSTEVQLAQRDVDDAQNQVDRAQQDLDRLTSGPVADLQRAAERDVLRAQNAVKVAQAVKLDTKATDKERADRDAAIAAGQLDLQAAQDRLAKLKQPPSSADMSIATRNLQLAQSKLDSAKLRLKVVKQGPDQNAIDRANSAVDNADLNLQTAQQRLSDLQAHPTIDELRTAQDKLSAARAALERANQLGNSTNNSGADPNSVSAQYNMVLLQKDIARSNALVNSLRQDLDSTKLVAPFTGVITSLQVHTNDLLDPGTVVLFMARPGDPVVRVDLGERDLSSIAAGQPATFKSDSSSGDPLPATISTVSAPSGSHSIAQVRIDWNGHTSTFGTIGQLEITTRSKTDALLIPKKALHAAGSRRYVQYQDGQTRKNATVEVGIQSDSAVEIISGLTEGQLVYTTP